MTLILIRHVDQMWTKASTNRAQDLPDSPHELRAAGTLLALADGLPGQGGQDADALIKGVRPDAGTSDSALFLSSVMPVRSRSMRQLFSSRWSRHSS